MYREGLGCLSALIRSAGVLHGVLGCIEDAAEIEELVAGILLNADGILCLAHLRNSESVINRGCFFTFCWENWKELP